MADVRPVVNGQYRDWMGEVQDEEELPDPATCQEGDTCTIHTSGNSGYYQTEYRLEDGQWVEVYTTIPWQLRV